jgi:hypothetical protein
MNRQSSDLPNYISHPYPWRTHYNTGERFSAERNQYVSVNQRELLLHTFELLFPKLSLNFEITAIDPVLFEYALYYKYWNSDYCNMEKKSENFVTKCLIHFNQLKQEVSVMTKNPKEATKKAVAKKQEAEEKGEVKTKKAHVHTEGMQYCINLVVQQKLTDDEIMAVLAKEFPGVKVLNLGRKGLSYLRWHLNNGNTKINGNAYTGAKLVRIREAKEEKKAAPTKTADKTPAKAAAKPAAPAKTAAKTAPKTAGASPAKLPAKTQPLSKAAADMPF